MKKLSPSLFFLLPRDSRPCQREQSFVSSDDFDYIRYAQDDPLKLI